MPELTAALEALLAGLPAPDPAAPVRLWIDRAFTIRGAGTVVTGTLAAGTVAEGDRLRLGDRDVVVRGVQTLGEPVERAAATARVALNLRGVAVEELSRGDALLTPGAFRVHGAARRHAAAARPRGRLPDEAMVHIGSATVAARLRPLDGAAVRLRLAAPAAAAGGGPAAACATPAPGGCSAPTCATSTRPSSAVAVPPGHAPPSSPGSRPAPRAQPPISRAAGSCGPPTSRPWAGRRRPGPRCPARGCWRPDIVEELGSRIPDVVTRYRRLRPLEPGPPTEVVRRALELPDADLVPLLVREPLDAPRRAGRRSRGRAARRGAAGRRRHPGPAGARAVRRARGRRSGGRRARRAGAGGGRPQRAAGADRRRRLPGAGGGRGGACPAWPGSPRRSRSARRGRRGRPAGGSPSPSWSGWTPRASPSVCRTTPAACDRGPRAISGRSAAPPASPPGRHPGRRAGRG